MVRWLSIEEWLLPVRGTAVLGAGLLLLGSLILIHGRLERAAQQAEAAAQPMAEALRALQDPADYQAMLRDLQLQDLDQFKATYSSAAVVNKMLFESGLSLQEERRLLEKQYEIMTTYLMINPALQRVFLMRGDEPLNSYLISYIPLKRFAVEVSTAPLPDLPATVRIISKERFAHPERGRSEVVDGVLQWTPPQVGTSVRSRALGEYVMFTNSALILHGPPVDDEAHEQFPHACVGLSREAAQRLYRGSFIGTRVLLQTRGAVE